MTDKAHFKPTERFSGLADVYAAARPSYPAAAIDFTISRCALTDKSTVVDIGCGTGISSRLYAERGVKVIGLEPNADMRAKGEEEEEEEEGEVDRTKIDYRPGTGESTGLPQSSVDALVAAQAFHWFEPQQALSEFHRILKPGGWAILLWNERDENDPFTAAFGTIIRAQKETASVEMQRGHHAGEPLMKSTLFTDADFSIFPNQQIVDEEGLILRACSASYAPKQPIELEQMKQDLRHVFKRFAASDRVTIKYETLVFTARVVDS